MQQRAGSRRDRLPQLCTLPGRMRDPRSMSLDSPSSVKCVKDKSRAREGKWAAVFLHLELLRALFSSTHVDLKFGRMTPSTPSRPPSERAWAQAKASFRFHFLDHDPVILKRKEDSFPFRNVHLDLVVSKIIFLLLDSLRNLPMQLGWITILASEL